MEGMEDKPKPQYTMAGVMFFLQQEAKRYEKEKSEWAVQRALLQVQCLPYPIFPFFTPFQLMTMFPTPPAFFW